MFAFPPEFPDPNVDSQWNCPNDLVIADSNVMTFRHTKLKINGEIILRDNAKLNLEHCIVELADIPGGADIILSGNAILDANTTIFGGGEFGKSIDPTDVENFKGQNISVYDRAEVHLDNSFVILLFFYHDSRGYIRQSHIFKEPLGLIHAEDNAEVTIEDSFVGALWLAGMDFDLAIDGLVPGYFENWSIRNNIDSRFTYNVRMIRSELKENTKGYDGGIEMGWNVGIDFSTGRYLTISNSRLNKIAMGFDPNEDVVMMDLQRNVPVDFDYRTLHLGNTIVQTQWQIRLQGGGALMENCDGVWLFMLGGGSNIHMFNSHINEIDPKYYTGTLVLENTSWTGGYEIFDYTDMKLEGSVRMLNPIPIFDTSSKLTRSYDVQVIDDYDGHPLTGIDLILSKDSNTVWTGVTDVEGKAAFDIVFDYNNCDDDWVLTTSDPNITLQKHINLRLSNPVVISLEVNEVIGYRSVVHVDDGSKAFPNGTQERPYPTIQEAIWNASNEIIRVGSGNYQGLIRPGKMRGGIFLKENVQIVGSGPDYTILQGSVTAEDVNGSLLSGFHIEDGVQGRSAGLTLKNNLIEDVNGVAVWVTGSDLTLLNNTIAYNKGDGVFLHEANNAKIKNNIFAHNQGFGISGMENSTPMLSYNAFWQNTEDIADFYQSDGHDVFDDPNFMDAVHGNYHLRGNSPCIDAGDPNDSIGDELFPNGGIVNMGAYGATGKAAKSYADSPACATIIAGDINGDCIVNFIDLCIMAMHWCEDSSP